MVLKLFSPQEARELNTAQNNRDRLRITETQQELRKKQLQLADAEASFHAALARQRDVWALEEKNHAERFFTMDLDVKNLEKRKEEALIPIAEIEKEAHTMLNEAETRLSEVNQKEIDLEDTNEALMKRLDEVSDKEQELLNEQQRIEKRKEAIQQEEDSLSKNRESLSESIIKYNLYIKEQQAIISQEKTALMMRERSIEARTELLTNKELLLQEQYTRLLSERQALDSAWNEYKTMNPNDVSNYPNVTVAPTPNGSNQPVQDPTIDTSLVTEDVTVDTTPIEAPAENAEIIEEEVVGTDEAPLEQTVSEVTE